MKILVKARSFFEARMGTGEEAQLLEQYRVISINSVTLPEKPPFSRALWEHTNLLILHFDDVEDGAPHAMTGDDAARIARFVRDDDSLPIMVHCTAGVSRSGAVGEVLNWYFNRFRRCNGVDWGQFSRDNPDLDPNDWVRRQLVHALTPNHRPVTLIDFGHHRARWWEHGVFYSEPAVAVQNSRDGSVLGFGAETGRGRPVPGEHRRSFKRYLFSNLDLYNYMRDYMRYFRSLMINEEFFIATPHCDPDPVTKQRIRKLYRVRGFEQHRVRGFEQHTIIPVKDALNAVCPPDSGVMWIHSGAVFTWIIIRLAGELRHCRSLDWGGNIVAQRIRTAGKAVRGRALAELLKQHINQRTVKQVWHRNLRTRESSTIEIHPETFDGAFDREFAEFTAIIREMLAEYPGVETIRLSGGNAQFQPFVQYLTDHLELPVTVDDDPENAILTGMGRLAGVMV